MKTVLNIVQPICTANSESEGKGIKVRRQVLAVIKEGL